MDTDAGHWESPHKFDVDEWYGFIYQVTNSINGIKYIGRKNFRMRRSVKIKGRKNRKITYVKSNWKTYTTSSKYVNDDIKMLGKENFKFEIIELCKTKGDLSFREVEIQWQLRVLSEKTDDGEWKYYNRSINAVRFRLSSHSEEAKRKMSKAHKGKKLSEEHKEKLKGHIPQIKVW